MLKGEGGDREALSRAVAEYTRLLRLRPTGSPAVRILIDRSRAWMMLGSPSGPMPTASGPCGSPASRSSAARPYSSRSGMTARAIRCLDRAVALAEGTARTIYALRRLRLSLGMASRPPEFGKVLDLRRMPDGPPSGTGAESALKALDFAMGIDNPPGWTSTTD